MKERLFDLIDGFRELDAPQDGRSWTEHLTDYLLANGVIVPPVKVGDTVWLVDYRNRNKSIEKLCVAEITVRAVKSLEMFHFLGVELETGAEIFVNLSVSSFGKYVFTTQEEAERALAERQTE